MSTINWRDLTPDVATSYYLFGEGTPPERVTHTP